MEREQVFWACLSTFHLVLLTRPQTNGRGTECTLCSLPCFADRQVPPISNVGTTSHILIALLLTFADKSPQMNDFLQQIKGTQELNTMFENIQKDALTTTAEVISMDTS